MGSASVTQDEDERLQPGEIGIREYLTEIRAKNGDVKDSSAIISSIESELENIAGTINRTIELIELDPQVQFCINGRDLSQITGEKNAKTTGRFPNLLNQKKVQIAASALRKAQDNYNAKFQQLVAEATKDADADLAQYMCNMLPYGGSSEALLDEETPLVAPYSISYEVGLGIDRNSLLATGASRSSLGGSIETSRVRDSKGSAGGAMLLPIPIGGGASWNNQTSTKIKIDGGYKEVTSVFDRESRNCHVCTTVSYENCEQLTVKGMKTKKKNCQTIVEGPTCEDISM